MLEKPAEISANTTWLITSWPYVAHRTMRSADHSYQVASGSNTSSSTLLSTSTRTAQSSPRVRRHDLVGGILMSAEPRTWSSQAASGGLASAFAG